MRSYEKFIDTEGAFYKSCQLTTQQFVESKLASPRFRMLDRYDVGLLAKNPEAFVLAIGDILRNVVQAFFKIPTPCCQHCGSAHVIHRCHPAKQSRVQAARTAVQELWTDNQTPINVKQVLERFFLVQARHPIFFMCSECHKAFDGL
jgi:hypothetical protein